MNRIHRSLLCLMGAALCCALLAAPGSSFAAAADAASWQGTYKDKDKDVVISIEALPDNKVEVAMFDNDPTDPDTMGGSVIEFTTADITATEVKSGTLDYTPTTYRLARQGKTIIGYDTYEGEKELKTHTYTQVSTKPVKYKMDSKK